VGDKKARAQQAVAQRRKAGRARARDYRARQRGPARARALPQTATRLASHRHTAALSANQATTHAGGSSGAFQPLTDGLDGRGVRARMSPGSPDLLGSVPARGDGADGISSVRPPRFCAAGDAARFGAAGDAARFGAAGDAARFGAAGDDARFGAAGDDARFCAAGDEERLDMPVD